VGILAILRDLVKDLGTRNPREDRFLYKFMVRVSPSSGVVSLGYTMEGSSSPDSELEMRGTATAEFEKRFLEESERVYDRYSGGTRLQLVNAYIDFLRRFCGTSPDS
jgi:hypothetical protein